MTPANIRDAATVVLLRRSKAAVSVLMGMRGDSAAFMPSKFVFPGGAVDPEDSQVHLAAMLSDTDCKRLAAEQRHADQATPHALASAALRELAEETGLLIGRKDGSECPWPGYREKGLSPDASRLRFVFRAITPPGRTRRFDARFFVAEAADVVGDPDDFSQACDELSHLHWVRLSEARALDLPFITEVVIAEIAEICASSPPEGPLRVPATVPFFDNRGPLPRFAQLT